MSGAVQPASSIVLGEPVLRVTVGAAGASGGSFTSVTSMVTAIVSSMAVSALPLNRPSRR